MTAKKIEYNIKPSDVCCFNCERWSGGSNVWAKAATGWCMKKRAATKAADICGYFKEKLTIKPKQNQRL